MSLAWPWPCRVHCHAQYDWSGSSALLCHDPVRTASLSQSYENCSTSHRIVHADFNFVLIVLLYKSNIIGNKRNSLRSSEAWHVRFHVVQFSPFQNKLETEKDKLAADLESARELSHRVIADRMQLQAEKTILVQQLQEQAKLTNLLEVQLRK